MWLQIYNTFKTAMNNSRNMIHTLYVPILITILTFVANSNGVLITWTDSVSILEQENGTITFKSTELLHCDVHINISVTYNHSSDHIVPIIFPNSVVLTNNTNETKILITGVNVGQAALKIEVTNETECNVTADETQKIHVYVRRSEVVYIISQVIGWIYFFAWSISFYPQVILNYKRESVVGLNFDYLAYNLTGFIAYGLYNIGLYWIPEIQRQYFEKYPDAVIPVQLNDVVFVIHAVVVTLFTIFQCFIYDKQEQRISNVARILLSATWAGLFAVLFVAVAGKITWLTYLMVFSYVKLGITLIKYIPQAYMNYRRKSTVGWSIGNVLLDCTGGSFSILQMMLESYNNDQWDLIFGDPTKFGLGAFSILFDILFIFQHYILYRNNVNNLDLGLLNDHDDEDDVFDD